MSRIYNVLLNELPEYIVLYGERYPVFTSFANWLKISMLLEEKGLDDAKTLSEILKLCYKEKLPKNIGSAIAGVLAFLNGDTDISVSSDKKKTGKVYSFFEDSNAIYASFFTKYGIDLCVTDMHWYKFCALFQGLADENPFATLIKIRTIDEKEIKNAKSRRKIMELKERYALKNNVEIDVAENISSLF